MAGPLDLKFSQGLVLPGVGQGGRAGESGEQPAGWLADWVGMAGEVAVLPGQ